MDLQRFGWMFVFYLLSVLHFGKFWKLSIVILCVLTVLPVFPSGSAILFPENAGLPESIAGVLLANERQTLNGRFYHN